MEYIATVAAVTFITAFLGFQSMLWAKKKNVAKWLVVPARKSTTGAILLGGLIIFGATTVGMIALNQLNYLSHFHFFAWGVSGAILVGLGYLDDRKEIRPFAKLTGQFIASYVFANFCGFYLQDAMSMIFFNVFFFLGFAVFNGSNLIDGVDTISAKTSIVSYLSYFAIGYVYQIDSLQMLSLLFIAPMVAFWWFNRAPSKIHIGEIGGGIIGLSMMFLAFVCYNSIIATTTLSQWQVAHLAASGLLLPVVELGISFLRRLWAARSPFNGDKLHLHHILMQRYGMSPTSTASVIALSHAFIQGTIVFMGKNNHVITAFWTGVAAYLFFQVSLCYRAWDKRKAGATPLHYVMDAIKQKNVMVISADLMDDISFDIVAGKDSEKGDQDIAA